VLSEQLADSSADSTVIPASEPETISSNEGWIADQARNDKDSDDPSDESSTVQPPRQAPPATPPSEGNSDSAIAADSPVIPASEPESTSGTDGDGNLQVQAVPINPWSAANITDVPVQDLLSILSVPGISDEYTVTFESEGATYKTVTVAKNQASPAVANPTSAGKVFTGWIYTDTTVPLNPVERPFNFIDDANATIITGNLTVTATFAASTHKVYFMSADPANDTETSKAFVLYTAEVADDDKTTASVVDFPEGSVPQNQVFAHWSLKDQTAEFDFTNTSITQDITLIPQFVDGYIVTFISGGSAVDPQVVAKDGLATDPTDQSVEPKIPNRTGYYFVDWYDNAAFEGAPFDFATPINATTTLYGKWTGYPVKYTVVYWLEKPNIPLTENSAAGGLNEAQKQDADNFIFVYSDDSKTAAAGTSVQVSETDANKTNAATANSEIISLLNATDFPSLNMYSYSHSDNKVIAGNGTTVVNVYFTRNVWTFNINVNTYPSSYNNANASLAMKVNGQTLTGASINYQLFTKIGLRNDEMGPSAYDEATGASDVFCVSNATGNPVNSTFTGWGKVRFDTFKNRTSADRIGTFANSYNNSDCTATYNPTSWITNVVPTRGIFFVESLDQDSPAAALPNPDYTNLTERGTRIKITTLQKRPDGNGGGALSPYAIPEGKQIFDLYSSGSIYPAYGGDRQVSSGVSGFLPTYLGGWYVGGNGNCYQWEQTPGSGLFYQLNTSGSNRHDSLRYYFLARASYSLTFDSQGGTPVSGYSGDNAILFEKPLSDYEPADPSNGTATFLGWFEKLTDTEPFDFATTMPANNLPLYAKWLENPRNVTFYADSTGTVEATDFAAKVANGGFISDPGALNPTDWGRDGSDEFLGWYQKTANGALVPYSWDVPVTEDLALYARWNPPYTPHHITYNTNGGGAAPVDSTSYSSGSKAVVKDGSNLSKDGGAQIFVGWRTASSDALYRAGSSYVMGGTDVTFVAQYVPTSNIAVLTFKQNASKSDATKEIWNAVKGATITYPDADYLSFKRAGYTFLGWSTDKDVTSPDANYSSGSIASLDASTTLYAIWKPIDYTVKYLPGEHGTFSPKTVSGLNYSGNTPPNTPAEPKVTGEVGWKFEGWDKAIASKVTENATYTAQWSRISYTVTYHGNGHSSGDAPKTLTVNHGEAWTVSPIGSLVKDGYSFLGWSTKADGSVSHKADQQVANITGNVNLYAIWQAEEPEIVVNPLVSYTVTYDGNGSTSGNINPVANILAGSSHSILQNAFARTGYTFLGWSRNAGATAATYTGGENLTITSDVTLYAIWQANVVAPTVVNPPTDTNVTEESEPVVPESPSFAGFSPADQQRLEAQTGNILSDLANGNVPLGGFGAKGAWSLLSGIMSIVAIIISIVLVIGAFAKRRRGDEADEIAYRYEESEKRRRQGKLLKVLTCLVGVATLIVWIVLDDFSQPMVWVNKWTLFVGIAFIVHLFLLVVYKLRSARKDSEYEEEYVA
jgi:uncharacterized repeat protein (TIGR02543 family)